MDFFSLQRNIENLELVIFTLNDIVKITGQKKEVVKSTLTRFVNQGKMFRLKTNYYSLRKIENKFQFQMLFTGSYISLHSALEFYGSTNQRFNNLDLITEKSLKHQFIESIAIQFHKVRKELFFGYVKTRINNTSVFISNIEKTIIDCMYFSSSVYLTDIYDFIKMNKEKIDKDIISTYLKKINSSALSKRIGYLLEINSIHISRPEMNAKYEKLNMNLGNEGERNAKWKLIINEKI